LRAGVERVRRLIVVLLSAAALAACGGVAGSSVPADKASPRTYTRPLKVLVLTQTLGFRHASIPDAAKALRRFAAADGRYQLAFLAGASELTPATLSGARAVVFLLTSGELPLSDTGKQALLAFVRRGGGLVGFHSASDTFHGWPAFVHLLGAEYSYHPLPSTQRVVVEDRRNPATRSLGRSFSIHEEFYVFKRDPRASAHVLARLDTGAGGPDRPLLWCRRDGRGRVFYDALGHFSKTWQDRRHIAIVSGGLAWALGLAAASRC
jgi:type 1 glutamine amidotransferase